jgi:hypothetical protein
MLCKAPQFPLNAFQILEGKATATPSLPDIPAQARVELEHISSLARRALPFTRGVTRCHLEDIVFRAGQVLKG